MLVKIALILAIIYLSLHLIVVLIPMGINLIILALSYMFVTRALREQGEEAICSSKLS